MTLHVASPVAHPQRIRDGLARLREAFPLVTPYLDVDPALRRPVDDGVRLGDARPAQAVDAREVDRRIAQRGLADLQYYNGDMHRAALALPNFVRALTA